MTVVLVAEDDGDVCLVLARLLERAGFTVLTAADGRAALQMAVLHHPDVVLTDFDMPGMTGLELCRAIRADAELSAVPVAILSGRLQPGDPRAEGVHLCGVMLKPFDNRELVAAVRKLAEVGPHDHAAGADGCPLALS
jgi:CheY-like chemotaxis protein